jgi:hypothetical protein
MRHTTDELVMPGARRLEQDDVTTLDAHNFSFANS